MVLHKPPGFAGGLVGSVSVRRILHLVIGWPMATVLFWIEIVVGRQ